MVLGCICPNVFFCLYQICLKFTPCCCFWSLFETKKHSNIAVVWNIPGSILQIPPPLKSCGPPKKKSPTLAPTPTKYSYPYSYSYSRSKSGHTSLCSSARSSLDCLDSSPSDTRWTQNTTKRHFTTSTHRPEEIKFYVHWFDNTLPS